MKFFIKNGFSILSLILVLRSNIAKFFYSNVSLQTHSISAEVMTRSYYNSSTTWMLFKGLEFPNSYVLDYIQLIAARHFLYAN